MVKTNIKALATDLQEKKAEYKSSQKEYLQLYKIHNFNSTTWYHKPEIYALITPIMRKMQNNKVELQNMKEEFRTQHIVNSMLRGKSISQIEPKTRDTEDYRVIKERCYRNAMEVLEDMREKWID